MLHPVFKEALPRKARKEENDLSTQDYITNIRHYIRAIPLALPNCDLDQTKLDNLSFVRPLHSLLEVIETLVSHDIIKDYAMQKSEGSDMLGHIEWGEDHLPEIIKRLREFQTAVKNLFRDPIEELQQNLGNAHMLAHDEKSFIQRACHLNNLSQGLFGLLKSNISCSSIHQAKLHLSGFLSSDTSFELLIADCEEKHWSSAKCRWFKGPKENAQCHRSEHIVCSHHRDHAAPGIICLGFDQNGFWDDNESQDSEAYTTVFRAQNPTLQDLILRSRYEGSLETLELKKQDKQILELVFACSLLNLDTSHWIRAGLDIDKISVHVAETSDLLARWKPYITCPLQREDEEEDENTAVLSFGLLLMEMEANKTAKTAETDKNWDESGFSRDSKLRRILGEWAADVDDGYKDIATACLLFRQLSEQFYDPGLEHKMKRTGAMYKYILAPLSRLVIPKFRQFRELFTSIPKSAQNRSVTGNHNPVQPTSTTTLTLFDGSEVAPPTQRNICDARDFMDKLEMFAEKIQLITDSSTVPAFAIWRADKIRIAILDTGIDVQEDTLIETALQENRIKECCGFVNDTDSPPNPTDCQDINGHGTHVTRLILNAAPSAEIIVAKISDQTTIGAQDLHRIARVSKSLLDNYRKLLINGCMKAIRWATTMKANIISMSCGLDTRDVEIDKAIHAAMNSNISIFAASANNGGNKPRAYPSRRNGVLCIHASDGMGNDGGISPTPLETGDNFSTLGIAVPSKWKGKDVFISGTSFSTPIAAALAADVLEFARHKCSLSEHQQEVLYHFEGVRQMVRLMVEQGAAARNGYHYVMPFHLWTARSDDDVAELITKITNS
ncbi:extracellular serine protease [Fusarium austroafricanum]|uniref:Extracellular serine protease n=1 Tax=Fusarium austroafricanum TaxID=2364996 RepID=A0A8H4NWH0_9HYPO|nr:extracellular serine protease [Fusarium austroafricanum]